MKMKLYKDKLSIIEKFVPVQFLKKEMMYFFFVLVCNVSRRLLQAAE